MTLLPRHVSPSTFLISCSDAINHNFVSQLSTSHIRQSFLGSLISECDGSFSEAQGDHGGPTEARPEGCGGGRPGRDRPGGGERNDPWFLVRSLGRRSWVRGANRVASAAGRARSVDEGIAGRSYSVNVEREPPWLDRPGASRHRDVRD